MNIILRLCIYNKILIYFKINDKKLSEKMRKLYFFPLQGKTLNNI